MQKLLLIAFCIAAGCSAQQQTSVRQFFSFTDAQAAAIQKLNDDYNIPWVAQQDRVNAIGRELAALFASNAPDPAQVGARALELEMIRRDRLQRQGSLQKQVASLLIPAQAIIAQTLATDAGLQPLLNDASCAYLLDSSPYSQWFNSQVVYGARLGFFDNPGLPYVPPASTVAFCGSLSFPASVQEYLALSNAQISAISELSAAYNDYYARQQNRLTDLRFEIQDLTATPGADPAVLGLRYAEMARIEKEITARAMQLRGDALAKLTPDQAAKVKTLQSVQDLFSSNLINMAEGCNLLPIPANGGSSFCPLI